MEKEKLLDAKIEQIRKKAREQEEKEKRLKEEEERILAELSYGLSKKMAEPAYDEPPVPDNAGQDNSFEPLTVRSAHMDDPEVVAAATKSASEGLKWRDERLRGPGERESRGKRADGSWAREWDEGKDQVFIGHKEVEALTRRGNNGYNGRGGGNRRSDPAEQLNHRGFAGRTAGQQQQQRPSTGWSQDHESQGNNGRNLRRSYGEDAEGQSQGRRYEDRRERRTSAGESGSARNGTDHYDSSRPRRGAGRGLATRRAPATGPQQAISAAEGQPAVEEDWGSEPAAAEQKCVKEEEQKVPASSPSQVPAPEAAAVAEAPSSLRDDETGPQQGESERLQPVLTTQRSEEEQFEDVNEEMPSSSKIEPEAPSSAFASMSASSVDLNQPASTNLSEVPVAENDGPSPTNEPSAAAAQMEEELAGLAAELISGAIDAALSTVEQQERQPDESQNNGAANDERQYGSNGDGAVDATENDPQQQQQ